MSVPDAIYSSHNTPQYQLNLSFTPEWKVARCQLMTKLSDLPDLRALALQTLGYKPDESLENVLSAETLPVITLLLKLEKHLGRLGLQLPSFRKQPGRIAIEPLHHFIQRFQAKLEEQSETHDKYIIEADLKAIWETARKDTATDLDALFKHALHLELIEEMPDDLINALTSLQSQRPDEELFQHWLLPLAKRIGFHSDDSAEDRSIYVGQQLSTLRDLFSSEGLSGISSILQLRIDALVNASRRLSDYHEMLSEPDAAQILLELESFGSQREFYLSQESDTDLSNLMMSEAQHEVSIGSNSFKLHFAPLMPNGGIGAMASTAPKPTPVRGLDKIYSRCESVNKAIAVLSISLPTESTPIAIDKRKRLLGRIDREVSILQHLNNEGCPNVPKLFDHRFIGDLEHPHSCILYMENYPAGDLMDVMMDNSIVHPTPGLAAKILLNLLPTLAKLHQLGIIYGDFKPDNIMLKDADHFGLVDFGLSIQLAEGEDTVEYHAGSMSCLSPDKLTSSTGHRSDIYEFASCLFYMLYKEPYHGKWVSADYMTPSHFSQKLPFMLPRIQKDPLGHYLKISDKHAEDLWVIDGLLMRMLHSDRTQRPSAEEMIQELEGKNYMDLLAPIAELE